MTLIQWISLTGSALFLGAALRAVYRGRLSEAYALIWLLTGGGMIVLSVSSDLLCFLSRLLGIQTPAFALLLCLICGALLLLFQITIVMSAQQEKIRRLTEELVLLKYAERKERNVEKSNAKQ